MPRKNLPGWKKLTFTGYKDHEGNSRWIQKSTQFSIQGLEMVGNRWGGETEFYPEEYVEFDPKTRKLRTIDRDDVMEMSKASVTFKNIPFTPHMEFHVNPWNFDYNYQIQYRSMLTKLF